MKTNVIKWLSCLALVVFANAISGLALAAHLCHHQDACSSPEHQDERHDSESCSICLFLTTAGKYLIDADTMPRLAAEHLGPIAIIAQTSPARMGYGSSIPRGPPQSL
ncbi:MAG: hypothetical protein IH624_16600 [Phycisphaerae bacterium]|nr:hypothetical protein [Phycisphaerae bacterium]